jgi:hypothetical protein
LSCGMATTGKTEWSISSLTGRVSVIEVSRSSRVNRRGGHDNAFAFWEKKPERYMVVTGYGLSKDGIWRPHSWCIDRKTGKIIETTERRTKYFGVEFSKAEFDDAQQTIQRRKSASQKPRKKPKAEQNSAA